MLSTPTIPADLSTINLRAGCGSGEEGDRCAIQEYRAWCGLDASSDKRPEGVCPVLHRLVIGFNDKSEVWRKALVAWLPKLTGSEGNAATRHARAFKAADWAVRVFAPIALDAGGRKADAEKLRNLAPIVDKETAETARAAAEAACAADAADAADAYAADAADAAAAYAAYAAAAYAAAAYAADAAAADAYAAYAAAAYAAAADAAAAAYAADAAACAAAAKIDPVAVLDSLLAINKG
jgi:hypothetical protein